MNAQEPTGAPPSPPLAPDGLPGLGEMADPTALGPGLNIALGLRYGLGHDILSPTHTLRRTQGELSVSFAPSTHWAFSVQVDARRDQHDGAPSGGESSFSSDPRLALRWRTDLHQGLSVGAEAAAQFVSDGRFPSFAWSATAPSLRLLFGAELVAGLRLVTNVGARIDRTATAFPDRAELSPEDQLSLRVSDLNTLLTGVGLQYEAHERLQGILEWAWRPYVGGGAPPLAAAQHHVQAGLRIAFDRARRFQSIALTRLSLGGTADRSARLRYSFEPQLQFSLALMVRALTPGRPSKPPPPPPPPPPKPGALAGQVVHADGRAPISGAVIELHMNGTTRRTETDAAGRYRLDDIPTGEVRIEVTHPDFEASSEDKSIRSGETAQVLTPLRPRHQPSQLQVEVRSFDGTPLWARVRITPGGRRLRTKADGRLTVELPPGTYRVHISARGHRRQRRTIVIEDGSVTVLNVDLRARK